MHAPGGPLSSQAKAIIKNCSPQFTSDEHQFPSGVGLRSQGAGAAYDLTKDTARTSQSRAELDRKFRKTGSAVVSRGDLSKGLGQVQLCLLCVVVLCKVSDEEQEGGPCNQRAAFT